MTQHKPCAYPSAVSADEPCDLDHRGGDLGDLVGPADIRRHRVDQVAEGAQPDAAVQRRRGGDGQVDRPVAFDDADGAAHPDIGHAGQRPGGFESGRQPGGYVGDARPPVLPEQQLDAGHRHRARQRIGHERGPVHQRAGLAGADGVRDIGRAQGGGQAEVSAGQRLADAHDVRAHPGVVGGEQLTRAAEAGGDLVEYQQHVLAPAGLAQVTQIARVVEAHPARALHDGLHDHGGQLGGVLRQLRLERGAVARVVVPWHLRRELLVRQDVGPQRVHAAVGVADAHRREGVPVVAAPPGHQPPLAGPAAAAPVLQRHLHRDLHRHRPGVAEEDRLQTRRGDIHQQPRQPGGGLVGQPTEHDVIHHPQLGSQRRVQHRVAVAVDRGPPGAHRVEHLDRLAVADQRQPRAVGGDRDDGGHRFGADGAVGMP